MELYVGTKLIKARAMTRQAYNDYRGWELPADENGADDGFLVEYVDGGKSNHPDHAGYISWSPADVFERAYRQVPGFASDALDALTQRFLSWKLPADFNPDGGIGFNPIGNPGQRNEYRHHPTGTNLFDYTQAKRMIEHILGMGAPTI